MAAGSFGNSPFFLLFLLAVPNFIAISGTLSATIAEKRQFLLPSFLFKMNEQPKRQIFKSMASNAAAGHPQQQQQLALGDEPMDSPSALAAASIILDSAASAAVPIVHPIRKHQKEPFAMRPCYFSPIQCLLHTPEHDRKFQNYPEFQQNSYPRGDRLVPTAESSISVGSNSGESQMARKLQIASPRVKAAVEALLLQKHLLDRKVKAQRMLRSRQSANGLEAVISMEIDDAPGDQQIGGGRQRLFGNPWRRGL